MFDESFVTRYLWSTQTNKMIKATKMVAKMSQTYDIPINYKQLGIYEDDNNNEDSSWSIMCRRYFPNWEKIIHRFSLS